MNIGYLIKKSVLLIFLLTISLSCSDEKNINEPEPASEKTIAGKFGQLSVSGAGMVDKNGDAVQLSGMSLFWCQWASQYYNYETIKWLRDDWKCTLIRAAMGVESGGYLENPEREYQKIKTVIDACINLGIYVIVDWHDHHGEDHLQQAQTFFNRVSSEYGSYPNIIYEIYNEPLNVSWKDVLKPYSESVINTIRANDPNNVIIVGTPNWSQDVDAVINYQIADDNVAYSLHFYTGTHRKSLRDKAALAMSAGLALFVSEWGMSEASGTGEIDNNETNLWINFVEQYKLSWCNWSVTNKDETSAALLPTTSSLSGWNNNELSLSGSIIRDYLIRLNGSIYESLLTE